MQIGKRKRFNMREAVDAGWLSQRRRKSSGTKPEKQDTSSSSGNYTTQAVDADIGPVNDDEPFAEDLPEFHEFFVINDLKAQLQANITLICDLKKQIKSVKEAILPSSGNNNPVRTKEPHSFNPGRQNGTRDKRNSSSRNSNLMNMLQMMSVHISSGLVLHLDVVWTKQFKPRSSSKDVWIKRFKPRSLMSNLLASLQALFLKVKKGVRLQRKGNDSNVEYLRANLNIKGMSNSRRTSLSNVDYMLYPSLLRTVTDWKGKPSLRSTERSLLHDNIVPKPDLALELGKSISLTEAEEEAVAREVHATHARIVSGPDPEPMQEDQTGSNSGKLHVSLAGPNPEHMDDEFLATAYPKVHENLKLITDERVIEENPESHSGSMSSMKNLDDTYNFGDQFLYDKPTEDDQEKSKVIEESDSTIPDPSHQTVTSTPPVIAPFTDVSSTKPSSLVTPPPINTEATTITTSLPEITPFIALQLRVARLEQEMSEVKKTDHSADVLASIKSQVPTVVDKYLGTKLDDALLRSLERHTADLIKKYSELPGPESVKNQESEKSPKEIIRIKREQGEEKQESTYSIRNPANYHLYHALMEALIADEDAMDKEVAFKVKDHKRKHDSDDDEDDDDDEGPSAGSNQGRSAKRRRPDSAGAGWGGTLPGQAQPPPKMMTKFKDTRESDALLPNNIQSLPHCWPRSLT
ncbi:hypothetical protein Tco_1109168 [Tanacetum coccineum]